MSVTATAIIEMGSKLILTDAHGRLHEIFPNCIQQSKVTHLWLNYISDQIYDNTITHIKEDLITTLVG